LAAADGVGFENLKPIINLAKAKWPRQTGCTWKTEDWRQKTEDRRQRTWDERHSSRLL